MDVIEKRVVTRDKTVQPEFGRNENIFFKITNTSDLEEGEKWSFIPVKRVPLKKRDCYGKKQFLVILKPIKRVEKILFDSDAEKFKLVSGSKLLKVLESEDVKTEYEVHVSDHVDMIKRHTIHVIGKEKGEVWKTVFSSSDEKTHSDASISLVKKIEERSDIKKIIQRNSELRREFEERKEKEYGKVLLVTSDYYDCPAEKEISNKLPENVRYVSVINIDDVYYAWWVDDYIIVMTEERVSLLSKEKISVSEEIRNLYNLVRLYRYLKIMETMTVVTSSDFVERVMQCMRKLMCAAEKGVLTLEQILFSNREENEEKERFVDGYVNNFSELAMESKVITIPENELL